VGERCRREIVIWSPQRPKAASIARFGQGVFEVIDHDVDFRRKITTFYFIFAEKSVLRVSDISGFFSVCSCAATTSVCDSSGRPQGDPTSDWGGHLTLAGRPTGKWDSFFFSFFPSFFFSPTAVANVQMGPTWNRNQPRLTAVTTPKTNKTGSCEPQRFQVQEIPVSH